MQPYGLSMNKLALDLRVPVTRITETANERRGMTADTALRLARYFKTTPQFCMNMQLHDELQIAEDEFDFPAAGCRILDRFCKGCGFSAVTLSSISTKLTRPFTFRNERPHPH